MQTHPEGQRGRPVRALHDQAGLPSRAVVVDLIFDRRGTLCAYVVTGRLPGNGWWQGPGVFEPGLGRRACTVIALVRVLARPHERGLEPDWLPVAVLERMTDVGPSASHRYVESGNRGAWVAPLLLEARSALPARTPRPVDCNPAGFWIHQVGPTAGVVADLVGVRVRVVKRLVDRVVVVLDVCKARVVGFFVLRHSVEYGRAQW